MSLEEMAREYALLKDELPEWWDGSREPPPEGPIESAKAALLYAELIGDEQSIAEYRAIIAGRPIPKRTPDPVVEETADPWDEVRARAQEPRVASMAKTSDHQACGLRCRYNKGFAALKRPLAEGDASTLRAPGARNSSGPSPESPGLALKITSEILDAAKQSKGRGRGDAEDPGIGFRSMTDLVWANYAGTGSIDRFAALSGHPGRNGPSGDLSSLEGRATNQFWRRP
jgi:hypothetical protein